MNDEHSKPCRRACSYRDVNTGVATKGRNIPEVIHFSRTIRIPRGDAGRGRFSEYFLRAEEALPLALPDDSIWPGAVLIPGSVELVASYDLETGELLLTYRGGYVLPEDVEAVMARLSQVGEGAK